MAEVGAPEQTELIDESKMTEDQYYGNPELGKEWAEELKKHGEKKRIRNFKETLVEKRHKVLRDRFSLSRKHTEEELEALHKSGEDVLPDELIKYLDLSSLDLPLKEALVQNYSEYRNMSADYNPKWIQQKVNENYLIKQLKEHRPEEPLRVPVPARVPTPKLAAVAAVKK